MKTLELKTKLVSINSRYVIARGRNILSADYRAAKEALKWEIHSQWQSDPITTDVCLNIYQYLSNPRQDIDAYLKIILDAMSGVVYNDDSQIVELSTLKFTDKSDPRIVVQIL